MGWWEDESELYIAMEYLHLGDLGTLLSTSEPLPEGDAQHITFQILEGLFLMHQNGFSHRDLKPQVCFSLYAVIKMTIPHRQVEHPNPFETTR